MATEISREQFFGMAGLNGVEGAYTPISLGKENKVADANNAWMKDLRHIDFTDAQGLKALTPENVTATDVFVNGESISKYMAIVGDVTGKVYSIRSNKYQIAQNKLLVDSLAGVSDNTGIQVFGRLNDQRGRMAINAFFADPECNIDFGTHDMFNKRYDGHSTDPYMLGVRVYNSHTGDTGFGAEIIGVRALCSNMVAFGDVLGKVSWNHVVSLDKVVDLMTSMIESHFDKVPVLKDKIVAMNNEELTLDEAECALWGISLRPPMTEGIMENMPELNPEVRHKNGKVSVYDVFNAATAYNSYANTGRSEYGRSRLSRKTQRLIVDDINKIIDDGADARQKYIEAQTRMTSQNTQIVAY